MGPIGRGPYDCCYIGSVEGFSDAFKGSAPLGLGYYNETGGFVQILQAVLHHTRSVYLITMPPWATNRPLQQGL